MVASWCNGSEQGGLDSLDPGWTPGGATIIDSIVGSTLA